MVINQFDDRPTRSGASALSRRLYCPNCGSETWYRHEPSDAPYTWECRECERTILQNPWVSESHPTIDEPVVLKEGRCKRPDSAHVATEAGSARDAEDGDTMIARMLRPSPLFGQLKRASGATVQASAPLVAVQASFL